MAVDRRGLVAEHAVEVCGIIPESPLTVGNGELCFTVDVTGLQTWPGRYPVADRSGGQPGTLLSTLSNWGWHSSPGGNSYRLEHVSRMYETRRGKVPYVDLSRELGGPDAGAITAEEAWLRGNPHRLDLLRMGFAVAPGTGAWQPPRPADVEAPAQLLNLWTGVITSSFRLHGEPVAVRTVCHPARDIIAVRVVSGLLSRGRLAVRLAFPYGNPAWSNGADWTTPDAHTSTVQSRERGCLVQRALDGTASYSVRVVLSADGEAAVTGRHEVTVTSARDQLDVLVHLSPSGRDAAAGRDDYEDVEQASSAYWAGFWASGAAVDLTGSADPRAAELQRRIVLSQYLTAINCSGSLPPQETGLTVNSWSGRFHLEMHWWHAAHFALWGRPHLLERALGWYRRVLPGARQTASDQGYMGARWPKQCGPDGREAPSSIGPFLLWQQAHPIYLAELVRRSHAGGSRRVMTEYADLVWQSASFMADYADRTVRGFELGPPLIPAQESYAADRARLTNPAFELAYWAWALRVAGQWRSELGLPPVERWEAVANGLVRPCVRDGVYQAVDVPPYTVRTDHPSMLYGYGFVPPTAQIEPEIMRATLRSVLADWDWASAWGWDFPAIAMTAARLGEPHAAVGALLMDREKNHFLLNGHNRQTPSLPVYLPANGGLLAAVAMLATGPGSRPAPGFPADGSWHVTHEGLIQAP